MSRAPPAARERLKEGGKVTQFLANLSKRGGEVQKKVKRLMGWRIPRDQVLFFMTHTMSGLVFTFVSLSNV